MSHVQENHKRLVASILQFLGDEYKDAEGVSTEFQEGIDVARQCLLMAYTVTAEEVPAGQKKLIDIFTEACPTPPKLEPLSDEKIAEAESFKQQGNNFMKEEKFEEAIDCYNKAIAIDPQNAVFYCNRAAAHTGRQSYALSLTDCKKSIEIDPSYSKAYSRMGLTYSKMELFDEAIKSYDEALKLDPENEGYKKNRMIAQEKQSAKQTMPQGVPGFPGLEGLGGMGNFLNNPMFMNMAKQVMENPAMQEMAMKMMGGMMGDGAQGQGEGQGASNSGGNPDMAQILQMGQQFAQQLTNSNPEIVEQLRNQMSPDSSNPDQTDESGKDR